jgi:hypothetical protein
MTDTATPAPAAAPAAPAAAAAPAAPVNAATALMGDPAAAAATPAPAADPAAPAGDPAKPADPAPAALVMPGKDATPEEWSAFYAQIGRPETPEGYELPLPDGDTGEFAKTMAPILHKHGVTADQAKGLAADWNAMVAAQVAEMDAADAAHATAMNAKNTAEAAALKNEWGQAHDANMHFAKLAVQQFMPTDKAGDVIAAIESKIGYKATIQFLHGIGKGLGEHDAAGMGANNSAPAKTLAERLYPGAT